MMSSDYDALVIDPDTGEILQWPVDLSVGRVEFLQQQHAEALQQEKAWELRKQHLSRALGDEIAQTDGRVLITAGYKTTWVAPKDREKLLRSRMDEALQWKVINQEQYDEIMERDLADRDEFKVGVLRDMLRAGTLDTGQFEYLTLRTPSGAYARTTPLLREEPGLQKRERAAYDSAVNAEAIS